MNGSAERWSRTRGFHLAAGVAALTLMLGRPASAQPCTVASLCGEWTDPIHLEVSLGNPPCTDGDEIGIATLIPVGEHKGRILFWTNCDDNSLYKSYIWDPVTQTYAAEPLFPTGNDHHFCSGLVWMPDGKLLVAGGHAPGTAGQCGPPQDCASEETLVFNALTATWSQAFFPSRRGFRGGTRASRARTMTPTKRRSRSWPGARS